MEKTSFQSEAPKLNLEGKKAVIFDLDGTLFDKKRLAFHLVMADLPYMFVLNTERKARKSLSGVRFEDERTYYETLYAEVAIRRHLSVKRVKWWYEHRYMPSMLKVLKKYYKQRQWVAPLMQELRAQGIKTAVYSDYGNLPERLAALGIDANLFDLLAEAPSMGGLKPCKESLMTVCCHLGVTPNQAIMVGDREDTDGESARRCGMDFTLVEN